MEIRDARAADAAAIAELLTELGYPETESGAARHLERFAIDPASRVQVAVDNGDILGVVATHFVPRFDSERLSCRVMDLVVRESAKRLGVGSALLEAIEADARRAGATRIDLSSADGREEAHAFYRARGFRSRSRSFTKSLH